MFLSEVEYFKGLANRLYNENESFIISKLFEEEGSYSVPIDIRQVYDIVRHPEYLPNSYVDLKGIHATLGKSKLTNGINVQYYIKFTRRGF